MCGRYTLHNWYDIKHVYGELPPVDTKWAAYNIPPMAEVPIVFEKAGALVGETAQWWLVPFFADDPTNWHKKARTFNARQEGINTKNSFRTPWKRNQRAGQLASEFYEWEGPKGSRQPVLFKRKDGLPLIFAAIYDFNTNGAEPLLSCATVTTESSGCMAEFHNREPVILDPETFALWLDPDTPQEILLDIMAKRKEDVLEFERVDGPFADRVEPRSS